MHHEIQLPARTWGFEKIHPEWCDAVGAMFQEEHAQTEAARSAGELRAPSLRVPADLRVVTHNAGNKANSRADATLMVDGGAVPLAAARGKHLSGIFEKKKGSLARMQGMSVMAAKMLRLGSHARKVRIDQESETIVTQVLVQLYSYS